LEIDNQVKSVVSDRFLHQSKEFYVEGIFVHKWDKCVTVLGDWVGK